MWVKIFFIYIKFQMTLPILFFLDKNHLLKFCILKRWTKEFLEKTK